MHAVKPHLPCYLAEWYRPDLTQHVLDDIIGSLDAAISAVSNAGTPVRLLVTLAVPTDEVLYGVFTADSPDAVVAACRQAGVPVERLSTDVGARIDGFHG